MTLGIYDVSGRLVRSLADGIHRPGDHVVEWDGNNEAAAEVASGIYFLRFETPDYVEVRQIGLLR